MGFNIDRFVSHINANFLCPICFNVLEDAVQDVNEHVFCRACIHQWLNKNLHCPVDRRPLIMQELKPVARIIQNFLDELDIHCEYKRLGCKAVVKLGLIKSHEDNCQYRTFDKTNNDVKTSSSQNNYMKSHANRMKTIEEEEPEHRNINSMTNKELREEVMKLNEKVDLMTKILTSMHKDQEFQLKTSEFLKNLEKKPKCRIKTVDAMVADYECSKDVRDALIELRCPINTVNDIVKNCNENNWPAVMSYPAARKIYEHEIKDLYGYDVAKSGYVLLILPHMNRHLPSHFIKEPGYIIKLQSYDSFIRC